MPTYEYACRSCGDHLEAVQSFSDDPLTECPRCGGPLRKVFGSIGITFKGSGFYKTDSRSTAKAGAGNGKAGEKTGEKTDKAEKSSSDGSSSGSGEGKGDGKSGDSSPAKKTETKPAKSA